MIVVPFCPVFYAGVDLKTVQYPTSHENSKVTMVICAKAKDNKPEELSEVVNDALKNELRAASAERGLYWRGKTSS